MLPEEVTKFIGQGGGASIYEVEKGAIKRFAEAVDDPNPIYDDEEYARKSRYGSIIAPPGFFGWPAKRVRGGGPFFEAMGDLMSTLVKAGYSRVVDGGMEYEFFYPIRAGDILAASSKIQDVVGREGKTGKMAFVITETTYINQNGDLVAKTRGTMIHREG